MATTSRLLNALVTEGLVAASYDESANTAILDLPATPPIPLIHPPLVRAGKIAMLDPMDIDIEALSKDSYYQTPTPLFRAFAAQSQLDTQLTEAIVTELESATYWTAHAESHAPPLPNLASPPITFEQSVIYGHPTHPWHKTRAALPPLLLEDSYDLLNPLLRLIAVRLSDLRVSGDFDKEIRPFLEQFPPYTLPEPEGWVALPVHELQVAHILSNFPDVHVYPPSISIPVLAQQSLRSVIVPNVTGTHLKLPLGVRLTSAVRTISPPSALFGVPFCRDTLPLLKFDRDVLTVLEERASVVSTHPDPMLARHIALIVRDNPSPPPGEIHIVCTSLVDRPAAFPQELFHLSSHSSRVKWFTSYISLLLRAFVPPIIHNGLAFECHPQNAILRVKYDGNSFKMIGFYLRDFGGLKIHAASLPPGPVDIFSYASPSHSIFASTIEDVWTRMYHTLIHNHIQQLARVMDLHYSGEAYAILREALLDLPDFPKDHPWLTEQSQPGKCFMRMRIAQMDRFHLHAPFPNLVLWKGIEPAPVEKRVEPFPLPDLTEIHIPSVPRWGKIEG